MLSSTVSQIPANVPGHLVRDFNMYDRMKGDGDYQGWFAGIHEQGYPDLFWSPANGGHWVVTRGHMLNDVLTNPELFSSRVLIVPVDRMLSPAPVPITLDPPDHGKYRVILNPYFSPKAVGPLGDKAADLTNKLIDSFLTSGKCEFMHQVAYQLPIAIFMEMAGLPTNDREKLLALVEEMIRPTNVDSTAAGAGLSDYARDVVRQRRANPGDDLISKLAQDKVDGAVLTEDELTGLTMLLFLGGLDTVAAVLGFTVNYLARHPQKRRELIQNPERIPKAVEELLRRFPVSTLARIVARDEEFHGVQLREGDMVVVPTMAHGLDSKEFEDPTAVDFDRSVRFQGAFGNGAHRCLGSMLARVELQAFLRVWLARIPDFRVKPGVELTVDRGNVSALHDLPLEWDLT
ncbi:MAG TPA: cytochrome P450 [Pseudomonas sp.]|nr:cytochrome P450 [Pseudomonas sp.]